MDRRVVVTGVGPVTPIGTGKEAFWRGLHGGKSGIRDVGDLIDLSDIEVHIGAVIPDFDPLDYIDQKRIRRTDRSAQFALASTTLAFADAGLTPGSFDPDCFGVVAGTGIGGMETFVDNFTAMTEKGPRRVSPFFVPRLMPNALAGEIAIQHGLQGANFGVVSACASGSHAIGTAYSLVSSGVLDCAVAGGAEAVLLRVTYAGFCRLGALSKRNDDPSRASRPFDRDRDGFVMGEGAGFVLLETLEHATARSAHIYGEIAGFGMTADATHITAPAEDGAGAARAMRIAMDHAGVSPSDVDYLNAHGTSTVLNDRAETLAIKAAFGEAAAGLRISSTKSQVGHLLGAAGGVEAIATLLSMENAHIPATLNYETPDPDCDLDYTPKALDIKIRTAISNSFGFGGQNASLLFRRVD